MPGALQVKVGFCGVALLRVPALAVQAKVSALGPASLSCADAERAMVPPTWTSAGLAPMPSIVGQRFSVPETSTLPVRGASWQVSGTVTARSGPPRTAKVAEPPQVCDPSVVVAEMGDLEARPGGQPADGGASACVDDDRLMLPVLVKPFGPVMV